MSSSKKGSFPRYAKTVWFRCDLRLGDNLALTAACLGGPSSLLPVYVFDPRHFNRPTLAGARKSSARRAQFLLESVANLRRSLEACGSGLAVFVGHPEEILPEICQECQEVVVQEGVCREEKFAETELAKRLKDCKLVRVWGGSMYMPDECGCSPDDIPLLFTAFKNKAEGRGRIQNPVDAPERMPPLPRLLEGDALSFLPTLQHLGYAEEEAAAAVEHDPRGVMRFEGGEDAAMHRLQKWMFQEDKLKDYFDIRNGMLGEGYSSKLSPWLALGCISPRRVWKAAQMYEKERVKNKSTYWLVFELTWRDFFIFMARSQGDKIFVPGGIIGDKTPWRGSQDALIRWKDGRVGDPLVDANMRELKATGFMSNRGRQNVASYLIFDLGVDWRYGAAHFEEHLLDYDPCSNWGNWLAAAGLTGQRINKFNTKKQLNDYDPRREYVRHWLESGSPSAPHKTARSDPNPASKVDDEQATKMQARAERFGTGRGGGGGNESRGGYPQSKGKGGRGKGGRDGGFDNVSRKQARWRKADPPEGVLGA